MSLGVTTTFGPLPPGFNVYIDGYGAITVDGFTAPGQPAILTEFLMVAVDETDTDWWGTESVSGTPIGTIPSGFGGVGGVHARGYSKHGKALNAVTDQGGIGYTKASITFTGDGSGASGHCVITGGSVTVVMDSGGFGYSSGTATITGDGSGASAITHVWPLGVGDFLIYNDQAQYEICQVISIDIAGTMMVYRSVLGSGNSSGRTHYLRCVTNIVSKLSPPNTPPIIPLKFKMGWENLCVVGMSATCGASTTIINLSSNLGKPAPPPYRPGLRTMSGAAYTELTASGILSVGQTADVRTTIQEWEAVRCVYGIVDTAPTGADIEVCVCTIDSGGGVLVIDGFKIKDGQRYSFDLTDTPADRQMPYHKLYATQSPDQNDWPPNILPIGDKGVDTNGKLIAPQNAKPGPAGILSPDTEVDFVINQVGSPGHTGADLRVVFQT